MRFLDFMPDGPDHIGPGGQAIVDTDVYLEATMVLTGHATTTMSTADWNDRGGPLEMTFTTSATDSDVLVASLDGKLGSWVIGRPDCGYDVVLDMIVSMEGTAHAVPDPSLGGVIGLGAGAAGAWMRRRHRVCR